MNIKRAKEEIKNAVRAYLATDDEGRPLIPAMHQRPILLIGPPGIGKTAIMEQVARECGIGLASYTMTHHTRQSAMGLPFIENKCFDDREYAVTSYTMSEIIASVYEKIENTGLKNGILFIDEINCVSETLAPVMLQFLQAKTFGNTKVPSGWIIVAAGNPSEYNRSVREFDVVTLDRVKRMDIEPDFSIWKEYALKNEVHQAIISYLEAKNENFYAIETTIDGKQFVTARGWEDLSDMLKAYEKLEITADAEFIGQYIAKPDIAMDFANYLTLYYKYEKAYSVKDILSGNIADTVRKRLVTAPFDERISVVSLVLSGLNTHFKEYYLYDSVVSGIHKLLKEFKENEDESFEDIVLEFNENYYRELNAGLMDNQEQLIRQRQAKALEEMNNELKATGNVSHREQFAAAAGKFSELLEARENICDLCSSTLENAFDFMEEMFAFGPESVYFVTELAAGFYSLNYISDNGCERFYKYNKSMLKDDARDRLIKELN